MEDPELTEFTKPLQMSDREDLVPVVGSDYEFIFLMKPVLTSKDTGEKVG